MPIALALTAKFPILITFLVFFYFIFFFLSILIDVGVNIYIPSTVEEIDGPLVDSPKLTLTDEE